MRLPEWIRGGELGAAVIVISALPVAVHLLTHPALLRRRLRPNLSEPDPAQRVIGLAAVLCALALVVVSLNSGSIDDRLDLSLPVPMVIVLLGDGSCAHAHLTSLQKGFLMVQDTGREAPPGRVCARSLPPTHPSARYSKSMRMTTRLVVGRLTSTKPAAAKTAGVPKCANSPARG